MAIAIALARDGAGGGADWIVGAPLDLCLG